MNCPHCQYVLFGLTEARCPECGREFEVTDFYFKPGDVAFLCPHCRQGYAGNDEFGLPRPRSFRCATCSKYVNVASMIVQPLRPDAQGDALRFGSLWEHRDKIGWWRGFFGTVAQIARRPQEFFRMAYAADRSDAFTFAGACGCALVLLALLTAGIVVSVHEGSLVGLRAALSPLRLLILLTLVIVVTVAWTYFFTILIHLTFACMGIMRASAESTVQVVAHAAAVLPALVVPPVGLGWYLYVIAAGLREIHGISRAQAWTASVIAMLIWLGVVGGAVWWSFL